MTRNNEDPSFLAAELAVPELRSFTLSAPRDKGSTLVRTRGRRLNAAPPLWQIEEFRGQKAFHRQSDAAALETLLAESLGTVWTRAEFALDTGTVSVLANRRGELTALRKNLACAACEMPLPEPAAHNRAKRRILEEGKPVPFLLDLGVMTAEGRVIASKYDKFRQINRYLEFVEDTLPELRRRAADAGQNEGRELTIVDFGCGKSYLTFAVYHYLANIKGLRVRILGLDLKDDVIASCSALAVKYGYGGLTFSVGDIAGFRGLDKADMVMTLHACDTATDAALNQAVRWGAAVILSVPCCQHELNAQLGTKTESPDRLIGRELLESAFRHGIVRERMAALLTDSLRAELLEAAGYKVQLLEFIDMTHTPKNLLIRAVLRAERETDAAANPPTLALSDRYTALKGALGVEPALERYLTSEAP